MNKRGFTLVELLVVMAIITILAAIAVPNVTGYIARSRAVKAVTEIRGIELAITKMVSDAGRSSLGDLFNTTAIHSNLFGGTVCDTAQEFEDAQSLYTRTTYALLRLGRGALTDTDTELGINYSTYLNADVVRKLGTSYFDIGFDSWGQNLYQIYPGEWPKGRAANYIPFRTFIVSSAASTIPGASRAGGQPDRLTLRGVEDPETGEFLDIGYRPPLDKIAYIYSFGENLTSGQALYAIRPNGYVASALDYRPQDAEIFMGGGDDPNNWDNEQTFMRFYN